jgi:hypothetical protein
MIGTPLCVSKWFIAGSSLPAHRPILTALS